MGQSFNYAELASAMLPAGFYNMVQVTMLIFCAIIALLLFLLLVIYFITSYHLMQTRRIKQNIEAVVTDVVSVQSEQQAQDILATENIFGRRGVAVLAEVFSEMEEEDRETLRDILFNMDVSKNLAEQLDSENEDYLIELLHVINILCLPELENEVEALMLKYKDNISLQYEAFLALARFGSFDIITKLCKDSSYEHSLSFRSLQDIIAAYNGNKPALYKELLKSSDDYITRICIKQIGSEGVVELASEVIPFLKSDNINLVIDAMRTLGMLKFSSVASQIAKLLKHKSWEVRSTAVSALAAIDAKAYVDKLIHALQDSEWQVRYNAGSALSEIEDDDTIRERVIETGDRFAQEMMDYMLNKAKMGRAVR